MDLLFQILLDVNAIKCYDRVELFAAACYDSSRSLFMAATLRRERQNPIWYQSKHSCKEMSR